MSVVPDIVVVVSSLALYRRYRPETFAEVIGQQHVTDPLQQALRNNRVNHAYLFSGPRGCGKTTSARILARCLNCEQGPTPTPCGECRSCLDLARNGPGSIDVIEIDAASHGGVDDARELREKAFFGPASSRYKIYIVDEAHMVTSAGFNALLKVVEEPPEHLKFIFATTEPEKVIGTIRSRTHHYPFRLVPPGTLRDHLAEVCEREDIPVDDAVLPLAVRAGAGSVRDSMSVMDQLLAGAGEDGVTYAMATALLGYTDGALLDDVVDAFAVGDGARAFEIVDRVIEGGHDPRRFVADLLERLRDLVILAAVPDATDSGLIDAPGDVVERMRAQAQAFGPAELSRAADLVNTGLTEMRGATSPRLQLELICARVLLPATYGDERSVQARLDRLERGAAFAGQGGAPAPGLPEGLSGPAAARAAVTGAAPAPAAAPSAGGPAPGVPGGQPAAQPGGEQAVPAPQSAAPEPQPQAQQPAPAAQAAPPAAAPPAPASKPGAWPGGTGGDGAPAGAGASGPGASGPAASGPGAQSGAQERQPGAWPTATAPGSGGGAQGGGSPGAGAQGGGTPGAWPGAAAPASQAAPAAQPSVPPAQPQPAQPEAQAPAPAAGGQDPAQGAAQVRQMWPTVLEAVKNQRRFTWILLSQNAQVLGFDGTTLQLGFSNAGARDSFNNSGSEAMLRQALQQALNVDWKVEAVVDPSGGAGGPSGGGPGPGAGGFGGGPGGQSGPGGGFGGGGSAPQPPPPAPAPPAGPPQGEAPGGQGAGGASASGAPGGGAAAGARQALAAAQSGGAPSGRAEGGAAPAPAEEPSWAGVEEDMPAEDDPDLDESAMSGHDLFVRELGATVIEEFHHE
nr:DNA polymerase III subunit gamma and tau [Streptomyces sp. HNM0574]